MNKNYYILKINNIGVTTTKLFGNKKGMLIYINEVLEETYIDYNNKIIGNYQTFQRAIKASGNKQYTRMIKETLITITKIGLVANYKGKEKE